jgi:hypothetical protein
LRIVDARGGDDNASAVAVLNGPSSEEVDPTPPPEVRRLDELAGRPTPTLSPEPVRAGPIPSVQEGREPETEKQGRRPDLSPSPMDDVPQVKPVRLTPTGTPQQRGKGPTIKRDTAPTPRTVLLAVGVLATALLVCAGVVGTALRRPGQPAVISVEDPAARAQIAVTGPSALLPAQHPTEAAPDAKVAPVAMPSRLFAPEIPAPPRRLPHRAVEFTQPPPGGAVQWNAVQAARNHNCARSLDMVRQGMAISVDHATLYAQAWNCFNDNHALPLVAAAVQSWEDFAFIDHHFQGTPEARAQVETPQIAALPIWARPAVGGVEYRIEAWSNGNEKDLVVEALSDLIGDPRVADDVARDLLLEAYAAAGLSQVEEPNGRVIDWWARRVFVLARALHGPPGELLEAQRPDVLPVLRTLLTQATTPRTPVAADDLEIEAAGEEVVDAPGGLPRAVSLAVAVALGADLPTGNPDPEDDRGPTKTTPYVARPKQTEPEVKAPLPVKLYRAKAPVIESNP